MTAINIPYKPTLNALTTETGRKFPSTTPNTVPNIHAGDATAASPKL